MNHTSKTLGEGRRKRTGSERKKDRGGADGGTSDILTPIYQNQNKERERERERWRVKKVQKESVRSCQ